MVQWMSNNDTAPPLSILQPESSKQVNEAIIVSNFGEGLPNLRPPVDEVGMFVAGPPFLARATETVIAVPSLQVFSTGLLVAVDVHLRAVDTPDSCRDELHKIMRDDGEPLPGRLHLAVTYPDGTVTQNLHKPKPAPGSPYRAALRHRASQSGPYWELSYWIRDLPSAGTVTLALEWPDREIDLNRFDIPGEAIDTAAAQVRRLWS